MLTRKVRELTRGSTRTTPIAITASPSPTWARGGLPDPRARGVAWFRMAA